MESHQDRGAAPAFDIPQFARQPHDMHRFEVQDAYLICIGPSPVEKSPCSSIMMKLTFWPAGNQYVQVSMTSVRVLRSCIGVDETSAFG